MAGKAASSAPAVGATTTTAAAPSPATAGAPIRVSANNASRAELQQAFEAAGIPNPGRIAGEVEEYRPYPTNDPSFAKLRQELAKYNIPQDVVSRVIATLEL